MSYPPENPSHIYSPLAGREVRFLVGLPLRERNDALDGVKMG